MCTHSIDDLLPHAPLHYAATGEMVKGSLYTKTQYVQRGGPIPIMNTPRDKKRKKKLIKLHVQNNAYVIRAHLPCLC